MAAQALKNFLPKTTPKRPQNLCCRFSTSPSPPSGENPSPDCKISTAVSVLSHHRSKSRWNLLRTLFPDGFSPTEFSQVVLQIRNNAHLALRFFHFTQRHSLCGHSLGSYATIVHVLSRARLKSEASSLIREAMRVVPDSNPVRVFEILVKKYKECGSAPFVFDLLIKCCLEVKKIDGAVEIARLLMSRGISPCIGTCNSLIRKISRSRGALAGYEIYRELFRLQNNEIVTDVKRVARIEPNLHTFNALMVCFYQDGALERVEEIWYEMLKFNCVPNVYSYSVLMAMYCEEGKMIEAEKLWNEMRTKGIEADVVAYNTLISGFCKSGEIDRAEEYFREMESSALQCTSTTYEHLIFGYCKIGDVDTAMLLYKEMCRKNLVAEASTIDAMSGSLCEKGRVSEALDVLKSAKQRILGLSLQVKSYEVLIRGLCEEGKMEEGLKLQAEMVGLGFRPDSEVYSAFIDGYIKQGNEEMAERLRKEMLETLSST